MAAVRSMSFMGKKPAGVSGGLGGLGEIKDAAKAVFDFDHAEVEKVRDFFRQQGSVDD
jgi:hypothetical protein